MDPYVRGLDNLAAAAFYNIAIKRTATESLSIPHWYDPVPRTARYPWSEIRVPEVKTPPEAKKLSDQIRTKGNDYFKKGEYFEALWKYEHALFLCRSFPSLKDDAAALHSNIAAVCLKFGTARRVDLLDPSKFPPSIMLWFVYTQQHATEAINRNPPPKIASKAYWRRGESFKEIVNIPELKNSIETMSASLPGICAPCSDTYIQVIYDFVKCVELQPVPDAKIFSEPVVLAVDHGHTNLISALRDEHVKSGFTTQLILELLKRSDTRTEHFVYVLTKMPIISVIVPHFEGSKVEISALLKKRISDVDVFKVLFKCGMIVQSGDFYIAKEMQQKRTLDPAVYRLIMTKKDSAPQVKFSKLKDEGNAHFSKGSYEQALGYYFQALNYCRKNDMFDEMATIRANCAQACLKLQMYSDAYSHCTQCLKFNPSSHKGYFRRAEALRAMLDSPQETSPPGSYTDVVKDYLESHSHQANVEAFCLAVIVAIDHNCLLSNIPKLLPREVRSGFSDKVLHHVLTKHDFTDRHLDYILFVWPGNIPSPFNASSVRPMWIVRKIRASKIYKRLFELGMRATEEDIVAAVIHLPDSCSPCLDIIMSKIINFQQNFSQGSLNLGCQEALKLSKNEMVVVLIQHGARPDIEDLEKSDSLCKHPIVLRYLSMFKDDDKVCDDFVAKEMHISEVMTLLNRDAREYFKNGKYREAEELYQKGVVFCEQNGLTKEAVTTHSNLTLAYLKQEKYYNAFKQATACLELDPSCAKAYFRRAEALKKSFEAKHVAACSHYKEVVMGYANVVDDYCHGNALESNPKFFTDALMVAVDYSKEGRMYYDDDTPMSFCSKVLLELASRPDCKPQHLQYLVCTLWSLRQFDASKVSLKRLFTVIGATELPLIQRLIELEMPVTKADISAAIKVLSTDQPEQRYLFKYIVSKCPCKDLDILCLEAYHARKIHFVFSFVELGAKPPGLSVELLEQALKSEDFIVAMDLIRAMPKESVEKIDLSDLMDTNLVRSMKLIQVLIDAGVNPNGIGRKSPIVTILSREYLPTAKQCEVISVLLMKGADCNHLCRTKKGTTSPLHVATEISLQADGNTTLITAVLKSPTFNPKKIANDKGETPLHIAVKSHRKREPSTNVLTALLGPGIIDPSKKDKSGKRPVDLLSKNDSRVKILEEAARKFRSDSSQSRRRQRRKAAASAAPENKPEREKEVVVETIREKPSRERQEVVPKKVEYGNLSLPEKFQRNLERLMSMHSDYFVTIDEEPANENTTTRESTENDVGMRAAGTESKPVPSVMKPEKQAADTLLPKSLNTSSSKKLVQATSCEASPIPSEEAQDMNTVFSQLGFDLDNLPWEVEGTERVVKFFKDVKRNSQNDRLCAARAIFCLAEGKRNKHLATLVSNEPGLSLYKARTTKSGRLLWEKAISYSSKLTGLSTTPVYTQVIRVWEIVLDHDDVERKIKGCTEQIEASHKRGRQASLRWSLKPHENQASANIDGVRGREMFEVPIRFLLPQSDLQEYDYHFVPAASTKENEYNITTFVSFDTIVFKSILLGTNERRDFPFKEWQKEHEIIKLCSKEAILLLGRSGTGKTTCCLYRLWNEFKGFWNPLSPTFDCKLPRRVLISPVTIQEVNDEDNLEDEEDSSDIFESSDDEFVDCSKDHSAGLVRQDSSKSTSSQTEQQCFKPEETAVVRNSPSHTLSVASSEEIETLNIMPSSTSEIIEEDLHQVFVTKNYVLCDQIKKRFFNMVAAHDFLDKHMQFESTETPNSFTDVENFAFPIFLTARQFYILLDNSLGEGETFFKRDSEGNLNVKISSLDYDHEDAEILLDLEESDSEDEDETGIVVGDSTSVPHTPKQHTERWTEVTALYFKEMVWPAISHQCQIATKDFDPLLVWIEIQSFIKGSERALRKGAPLSVDEYQVLGNRMAPNFSSHRETIYKLFEKYQLYKQRCRHSEFLFDECDLMLHLYKRLRNVKDVPWSFHSIYVDEVQDFTQAELTILIHCCRDPNSMFFTGDTAQSIMRGIAFRFQDLRTLFYQIRENAAVVRVPQQPHSLTINFRSHSGILKLAGSVIDLISEFFKDSIDHLPDDEGMFPGPTPVLVESCKVDELALLLSANKRKASAIEFGAHQAIIVQSKESKEKLPDILKGAIVLTIFEAKGLEFDDVLLYNFFTDSLVDEKGWRVITSYLQMPRHGDKIINSAKLPGSTSEPRSRLFDPKLHKSLNAELKYLYTAITRTKCNLWIYDSNQKMRLPMFDYWYKRELVKVVRAGTLSEIEGMYNLVFASNSTADQWKAQGDNFRKKHLWEQAKLCYERAGEESVYLAKEANAYQLIQNARQQRPGLYFEAAVRFLECDYLRHGIQYINAAALCLRNTKPPKYSTAAKLYEKLGELGKACQSYLRAKDFDSFIRIKEARGEYISVIRTLLGKPYMRKRDALMKTKEYEEQGIELGPDLSTSELSYTCAKFYSERRDRDTLVDVLQYMPEMERRVRFLKEAKLFDKAFEDYEQNKYFKDAFRLASAQGWFERGQTLAHSTKDVSAEAMFILQRAKSKYKHFMTIEAAKARSQGKGQSGHVFDKSQLVQAVGQDVIDDLSALMGKGRKQKNMWSTYAALFLGMITADKNLCTLAWRTFRHLKHKIGEIEAFNQVQKLTNESVQSVLEECHLVKEVGRTFVRAKDINNVVQQGLKFYDLLKFGMVYCIPREQDIWMTNIVSECQSEQERYDVDGMLRLEASKVKECISKHCVDYLYSWVSRFQLEREIPAKCESFFLHKQLLKKKFLERVYSSEEVSSEALRTYIQSCIQYLELRILLESGTDGVLSLILSLFSPQVTFYLSQTVTDQHVSVVRRSTNAHVAFRTWIKESTLLPAKKFPERVFVDHWLTSWRACCLCSPDMKPLTDFLGELEAEVNNRAKSDPKTYESPSGFIYWKNESKYYHLFSMWLISCSEIRESHNVLWSSKLAIYHFLGSIAASKTVTISVPNMVDVLSIHCTALLVTLCHVTARQSKMSSLTVPMFYKNTVQFFDSMNVHNKDNWRFLRACVQEVNSKSDRNLQKYFGDTRMLLIRSLDFLLGTFKRAPRFCVLKFALRNFPNNDSTRLCLILALTLFGNLIMLLQPRDVRDYHQRFTHILTRMLDKQDKLPSYVAEAAHSSNHPNFATPHEVFRLVDRLLRGKHVLSKLVYKQKHGKIEFVPLRQQPPRMSQPGHRPPPKMAAKQIPPRFANLGQPPRMTSPGQQHPISPPPPYQTPSPQQHPMMPAYPNIPLSPPPPQQAYSTPYPMATDPTGAIGQTSGRQVMHPPQSQFHSSPLQEHSQPNVFPSAFPQSHAPGWSNAPPLPGLPLRTSQIPHAHSPYNPAYPTESAFEGSATGPVFNPTSNESDVNSAASQPINANVIASCSIDELRKLASSATSSTVEPEYGSSVDAPQSTIESGFSFDFEYDYDPELDEPRVNEEQGYKELEEDEVLGQALTGGHTTLPTLPIIDPELIDPSIVTQSYCSVCGVTLKPDLDDEENFEEETDSESSEKYYVHVTSENHDQNTFLCKRFMSIVDSEDAESSYPRMAKQLTDLVNNCESLKRSTDTEKLDKIVDSIKVKMEKNNKVLTELQEKLAWREGVEKLSRMMEDMDRQLYTGKKVFDDVLREVSSRGLFAVKGDHGDEGVYEPEQAVGELEMLSGQYDKEELETKGKVRSAGDKQISRQRKKERKDRQRAKASGKRK